MPALDVDQVEAILRTEKDNALGVNTAYLAEERKKALDYYYGDMKADMPSPAGRSSAVSTDVADTVEGLMPQLMEIFAAGDEVVKFEPVGPEDEKAAEQETDYVNHVFLQKNPGFLILYSFIKDALLSKIGIVKIYWDKYERQERETYENQSEDAFMMLAMRPDVNTVDILDHETHKDDDGQTLHNVTLVNRKSYACAKVEPVPPEEFGISANARTLKDATYVYHQPAGKTESDLIAQGYDETQVKNLPTWDTESSEGHARDRRVSQDTTPNSADSAMREVLVTEHYKVMDYEGDGKPQLYRITTGGERFEVLLRDAKPDIVPVDMMPFAAATPIISPHRFFGRSVADQVLDIQRIKTSLLRALLDNAYLANNQRMEVAESHAHERTIDDLLVNRPAGVVRTNTPGGLIPIPNQEIGSFAYPLIEYIDGVKEARTGVTRQGQGLDANALQNQSATAVNQVYDASQARVKLIARVLAETGIRDLFSLLHATIRKNDSEGNVVRLRNQWVTVDPREWKTRDDMTITVGLGTGSKASQFASLQLIIAAQQQAILGGVGIVSAEGLYNSARQLTKLAGHPDASLFFVEPGRPPDPSNPASMPLQPPSDPKQAIAQQQAALQQAKMQTDAAHQKLKTDADLQMEQQKFAFNAQMEQQKFNFERELEMLKAGLAERQAIHGMQIKEHDAGLRAQERQQQAADAAKSKADQPLADILGQFGQHLAQSHAQQAQMMAEIAKHMSAPRRIVRDANGRVSHSEVVH